MSQTRMEHTLDNVRATSCGSVLLLTIAAAFAALVRRRQQHDGHAVDGRRAGEAGAPDWLALLP